MDQGALTFLFLLAALVVMAFLWLVARYQGKADIVDLGWSFLVSAISLGYLYALSENKTRLLLSGGIIFLWGFRLVVHLLFDRVLLAKEDGRYATLRASWGDKVESRFFIFFMVQGVLAWLLAFPFFAIANNQETAIAPTEWLGALLFILAWIGEAISDQQLSRFRRQPENRGQVCQNGLWYYSRHPNYFFQWLSWVAFFLLAVTAPYGWLSGGLCCLTLLFLITKVTGIPPTEAQSLASRPQYRDYQASTSAFFPWFRKQ